MPQQGLSPAQLDAMAKQAGYRSYAEWQAAKKRKEMDTEQRRVQAGSGGKSKPAEPPKNFLQTMVDKFYPMASPAQKTREAMKNSRK